jgi:hypothetical protein
MSEKEKQIKEMTLDIMKVSSLPLEISGAIAIDLTEKGYRKEIQGKWIYHESIITNDGWISGYSCSLCDAFVYEDEFNTDEFHKIHGFVGRFSKY